LPFSLAANLSTKVYQKHVAQEHTFGNREAKRRSNNPEDCRELSGAEKPPQEEFAKFDMLTSQQVNDAYCCLGEKNFPHETVRAKTNTHSGKSFKDRGGLSTTSARKFDESTCCRMKQLFQFDNNAGRTDHTLLGGLENVNSVVYNRDTLGRGVSPVHKQRKRACSSGEQLLARVY